MKSSIPSFIASPALLPVWIAIASFQTLHAVDFTWDPDTLTAGAQDGSGTWTNGSGNWRNTTTSTDDQNWANATTNAAIFGSVGGTGDYTVTLGSAITATSLTFLSGKHTLAAGAGNTIGLSNSIFINDATTAVTIDAGVTVNQTTGSNINLVSYNPANSTTGTSGTLTIKGTLTNNTGNSGVRNGAVIEVPLGGILTSGTIYPGGQASGSTGTLKVSGGAVTAPIIGLASGNNSNGTGILTVTAGSVAISNVLQITGAVGGNAGGTGNTGTATLSDGSITLTSGSNGVRMGNTLSLGGNGTATFHLNGGTLTTPKISKGNASAPLSTNFNFSGGTLKANASNAAFMTGLNFAKVKAGGAIIDTDTFNITIDQALLEDGSSAGLGLMKKSAGTLTLGGANTYTGTTTVEAGTLLIHGAQPLAVGLTTVKSTGLLGGNGSTGAAVVLESGSGLAATISDWNGAAGVGYFDLDAASLDAGGVPINLTISTTGLVNFAETNKSFTILNTSGGITNFSPANVTITKPGFPGTGTWSVAQSGNALVLSYAASAGYGSWANDPHKGNIPNEPPTEDYDKDGLSNLLEYALGLDPKVSSLPPGTFTGTQVIFTKGSDAKNDAAITYIIEQSIDLKTWTPVVTDKNPLNASVTYTLSATPKDFARLTIIQE